MADAPPNLYPGPEGLVLMAPGGYQMRIVRSLAEYSNLVASGQVPDTDHPAVIVEPYVHQGIHRYATCRGNVLFVFDKATLEEVYNEIDG